MIKNIQLLVLIALVVVIFDGCKADRETKLQYTASNSYQRLLQYLKSNPHTSAPTLAPVCPAYDKIKCNPKAPYRYADGSCNNLKYPWWGKVYSPFARQLQPDYDDGFNMPRLHSEKDNSTLPTAREVSLAVPAISDPDVETATLSQFFLFFAQLVSYDISHAYIANIDCSSKECNTDEPECFNIQLLDTDTIAKPCLKFTRALDVRNIFDCDFKRREQTNKNTHFLDLSPIYGSTPEQTRLVRAYKGGQLKTAIVPGSSFESLPILDIKKCRGSAQTTVDFTDPIKSFDCFFSGDSDIANLAGLTAFNSLFVREHNRMARELAEINKYWDEEMLFQEARRMLIGVYQNIIYSEFLPILLGDDLALKFGLRPLDGGYLLEYNEYVYPNVLAENAAAGLMAYHLIPDNFFLGTETFVQTGDPLNIEDVNFNQQLYYYSLESVLRGMAIGRVNINKFEFASGLNNQFNKDFPNVGDKSSLLAIDIQQARDFGIPSYVHYRQLSGQNFPLSFGDLESNFDYSTIQILKSTYTNVEDIDLIIGLFGEKWMPNAHVSRTHGYLIAKQFYSLKYGDRFYYENGHDETTRFTASQLNQVRHYKFSSLICNSMQVVKAPHYGFRLHDADGATSFISGFPNFLEYCSGTFNIDFAHWRSQKSY